MDENIILPSAEGNVEETAEQPLIEFCGVTKRYGSKTVLDELSFSLDRGRIVGLLGPNGSGKTTIIKLINGLLSPNAGEISILGEKPGLKSAEFISYLPERSFLSKGDRVCDVIDFFADIYRDFDRAKAEELTMRLRLDPRARIRTLSKGSIERLELILVMSRNAMLYILDEPFGGVDPAAREQILDMIISGYCGNGSILISTHLIADVERMLDDVIFLSEGKVALCASVELLKKNHGKTVDELFRELYRE